MVVKEYRLTRVDKSLAGFRKYLEDRVQPGTTRVYIHALGLYFQSLDGRDPDKESAQAYVDHLALRGYAPSTISTRAHAIMRWFRWKGDSIYLDCPTIRIGEPSYLSMEQVKKAISYCNTLLERVLVIVLFDTAVRVSELLNIGLDNIDWDNGFISVVRKGGRREEVNISDKAMKALKEWIDGRSSRSKRVFMDLQYMDAWNIINNIGRRSGMKLHPHIFRHSRAVQMLMSGATLHDVQMHLGHSNITTTANIYGRFKAIDLKSRVPSW